ncbi:MAG: hypothetical protein K8R92_04730 [Planctomycetes bacterium]|nr:hypothetical protein [Planctomycetota bacterium]
MKHKDKKFIATTLPTVRLYLDDIENIIQCIRDAGFEPIFSDDEYEFSTLEEFIKIRGTAPRIFELGGGNVSIRIQRRTIFAGLIFVAWNRAENEILVFKLKEILERRRVWFARVFAPKQLYSLAAVFICAIIFVASAMTQEPHRSILLFGFGVAFSFAFGFAVSSDLTSHGVGSEVNLAHRYQTTNFWSRNSEKIFVSILCAIVGIFLKTLWDKVFYIS